jgi:TolB-like protein/class 3 adenylate cyclase/Tfp pilus assembly protein PilF
MKNEPKRTCAAIMFSDIVGYTALMGEDQELAFQLVKKNAKYHQEVINIHHGKLIKELGDGVLCYFPKGEEALAAAYELQQHYFKSKELSLRIGIHYGEVILDRHDVFGDAVNIASRLQTLGSPGSILFSHKIREDIDENSPLKPVSLGKFKLKNVKEPLEVFALSNAGLVIPKRGEILKLLESRLKKFMVGGLVVLSLALVGFGIYHKSSINKLMAEPEKSIAVLPFENLGQTDTEDYLVEGLTEDIISQLSKISSLRVIAKSGVSTSYKDKKDNLKSLGLALNVNYLLEGNVQLYKNQIRIRASLIDINSNKNIWAETYENNTDDIFSMQTEIAQAIAQSLSAKLTQAEIIQLEKKPTKSFTAYEYYHKGRDYYYKYDLENNLKAIAEFKMAFTNDPNFALAWAGLGDAYSQNYGRFGLGAIWIDSAILAAKKAIEIDSNSSEGYKAYSTAYNYLGKYEEALKLLQKAVKLNPNNPQALGNIGTVYQTLGKLDQSLIYQKKAAGLNPKLYIPFQLIGWTYRLLGDYENATNWLNKSLERSKNRETYEQLGLAYIAQNKPEIALELIPNLLSLLDTARENKEIKQIENAKIYESAGIILFFAGDMPRARSYFEKSIESNPQYGIDLWAYSPIYLGYFFKDEGNMIEAEVILEGALHLNLGEVKKQTEDSEHYFNLASIYSIIGNDSQSLFYLKLAKQKNWVDIFKATHNPIFRNLSKNKEFKKTIQEIEKNIYSMREIENKN